MLSQVALNWQSCLILANNVSVYLLLSSFYQTWYVVSSSLINKSKPENYADKVNDKVSHFVSCCTNQSQDVCIRQMFF